MEYGVVSAVAFLLSALVLYSGFGLGTLLMPVFALFFPVPTAVASTAVVHLANNVFKIGFTGRHADWRVALVFGVPGVLFASLGALLLVWVSSVGPLATYHLGSREFSVTTVKLVVAALIASFAVLELSPAFSKWHFPRRYLALGGAMSGFFGGLSGHQGALRSAVLSNVGLSPAAFVGTGSVASVMVDMARVVVYGAGYFSGSYATIFEGGSLGVVLAAIVAAFFGTYLSSRFLKKLTIKTIRSLVGVLLGLLALALATGLA
ncbi:MAG: sulfite exporter TauE/SafE family protein [Chloroflexi bacterium]|nr:sulfite exporter TauE/SafE family protein [Chloroflexota bacterium]